MSIADELQLLINTKEQMREALGLDIDEPFSQYPAIAESKKVEVVQTTGQSTEKVMSQKAVTDLVAGVEGQVAVAENAADRAKDYMGELLLYGSLEYIYETPLDPPATNVRGASSTTVYSEPVLYPGVISRAYGRLTTSVSLFKAKVFEKVGSNFVLVSSSDIPVVSGATEHILDTPLMINAGQYIGFYCAGGMPRATNQASRPFAAITGQDASIVEASNYNTGITWQMYFVSETKPVLSSLSSIESELASTTSQAEILMNALSGADDSIGAPVLEGGSSFASAGYIPFAKPMNHSGFLKTAEFNIATPDYVGFFIARKVTGNTYNIIFETGYISFPSGINSYTFDYSARFEKGDLLGWKTVNGRVIFDISVPTPIGDGYYSATQSDGVLTFWSQFNHAQPRIRFAFSSISPQLNVVILTQAQYDELDVKDPNTLYAVL